MKRLGRKEDMPRRAISYARWSSGQQRKGRSAKRQREWVIAVCRAEGWLLDESAHFVDDGRSAFRGKNAVTGELAALLADVEAGLITRGTVLLVESLDRLSRDEVDAAFPLFCGLIRAGISIRTRTPDRFYDAEQKFDLLTMLEFLFIAARAHEESQAKSVRITDKWGERRRLALAGDVSARPRFPFWLVKRDGRFDFHPVLAPAARAMFALSAEGFGLKRLCREMNSRFPSPPAPLGGTWRTTTLARALRNRAALGELQPGEMTPEGKVVAVGEVVPGFYPVLVSEGQFNAAQAATAGRARRSGRPAEGAPNLFTGLVTHAGFRAPVCLIGSAAKGGRYRYAYLGLRADERIGQGAGEGTQWRYDFFESAMLDAIEELSLADVLPPGAELSAAAERMRALGARVTRLAERARTLQALAESPDATEESASDAFASRQRVLTEQREVAKQLARLKLESDAQGGDSLTRAQTLVSAWRKGKGGPEREALALRVKTALGRLVESIWVLPQRLTRQRVALHVQIYLHSGVRRPLLVLPRPPFRMADVWELDGVDFRAGNVGHKASETAAGA